MTVIMVRYCCWLLCFQCLQCIQWWRMILMSEKKEQTRSKQFLNFRFPPRAIFLIGFLPRAIFLIGFPPSEMGRGSLRSTLVQLLWHVKEVFSLHPSIYYFYRIENQPLSIIAISTYVWTFINPASCITWTLIVHSWYLSFFLRG